MKRREFVALFGSVAVPWPLVALAQGRARPVIGFLGGSTRSRWAPWTKTFLQRLSELGWKEGHTVAVEYRWSEGHSKRYTEFAEEFARLKVDVIVTNGSVAVAAKRVTSTVPIVFALAGDPLGAGLVGSLSRRGGNVTGLSLQADDLYAKRLGLLCEVLPDLRRLAIIGNVDYRASVAEIGKVQAVAPKLGLDVDILEIRRAEDIAPAFEKRKSGAEALYVCGSSLVNANILKINTLALAANLPTCHPVQAYVIRKGFMSYGPSIPDLWRRAADYVDKILRGTNPGDIPVEQPTKFELVFNLKTAKTLGLELSPLLLARADKVIE
jgi:putative ABC transport system substrate-binding protein